MAELADWDKATFIRELDDHLDRPAVRKRIVGDPAKWHDGNGVPSVDLGKNGHYYLDRVSKIVYVKVSGAWI